MNNRWRVCLVVLVMLAVLACGTVTDVPTVTQDPSRVEPQPTPRPARLEQEQPDVWHRPRGQDQQQVESPTMAGDGDRVWTEELGRALLKWRDLHIRLYRETTIRVEDITPTWNVISQDAGTALIGGRALRDQRLVWNTDYAEITLTGTTIQVTYIPTANLTLVRVFDGQVEVQNLTGTPQTNTVVSPNWALVRPGKTPEVFKNNAKDLHQLVRGFGLWDLFHEVELDVQAGFGPEQVPSAEVTIVFGEPTSTDTPTPTHTSTPSSTPTPLPRCEVKEARGLDLRYGPGTVYDPPIRSLPQGTKLDPLAYWPDGYPSGPWIEVRVLKTEEQGWVSAKSQYVSCNIDPASRPQGTPPATPTPSPTPDVWGPPAPTLREPDNGQEISCPTGEYVNVTLRWNPVDDASGIAWYDAEVEWYEQEEGAPAPDLSLETVSLRVSGDRSQVIFPARCDISYRWRVRAEDGKGNDGTWSTTWQFRVESLYEPVTILVWHQWSDDYLNAIEEAFNGYMEMHPNVTIDLSKLEDTFRAPSEGPSVAIPAGEGPDIIGWANDQIGTQALAGNIVALDDYGIDMTFLNSTYEPAAVRGVVWQNMIWGLPESQEGIAIVYNKDMVTDEYLPTDPKDFADLLAKATAFNEATGKYLVCNQGLGNPDAYHVAPIYFGHGVPEYVDDEGNAYMNTPEALAAAEWLVEFSAVAPAETSHDICKAMIVEGDAGAWWTGPWAIADLEAAGINYGIIPMGSPFVGIKTLMLSQNAVDRGNEVVALDIMKYFTSAEVQAALAVANKTIPATTGALMDSEVQKLDTLSGFGASLNLGVPMANTPYAGAQWGPVGDATTAVWTGAQTPQEAMEGAQAAIEQAIKDMQ